MKPSICLAGIAAVALLLAACSDAGSGDSSGGLSGGSGAGVEAVSAMIATTSESAEPGSIDGMSLTSSETAEPGAI